MKKSNFVMLVVAVILVMTCTCAFALVDEEQRQVLRGLERVHVVIKRLKPEIELDGLYRSTLETDVELTLRMAGIKVLSEEESLQTSGVPDLCLKVNALKCSSGYVYNIGLSLEEKVTLTQKEHTDFCNHLKDLGTTGYCSPLVRYQRCRKGPAGRIRQGLAGSQSKVAGRLLTEAKTRQPH